jgi:hypothetical protein
LLFIAVGLVVASVVFLGINLVVTANLDAGTSFFERWIIRAMCEQYELTGSVRDPNGRPVAYAVVEVSYLDERLTTRSNGDGRFVVTAVEAECERRPPRNVSLLVTADEFRPKRTSIAFEAGSVDVTLDPRDFRP